MPLAFVVPARERTGREPGVPAPDILGMLYPREVRCKPARRQRRLSTRRIDPITCSDYLAELSALPQSGIARIESSIPLPGTYTTHQDPHETEHASLYFLACISMRRLLNRVHQLLYARDSGAATDASRFPAIVTELDHQLDDWRDVLPPAFRFSTQDMKDHPTECGGFLRQRYLTCKSVIYRPYLAWLLANGPAETGGVGRSEILSRAKVCLDACTSHILGLTGFSHTILVDKWICVLS